VIGSAADSGTSEGGPDAHMMVRLPEQMACAASRGI
jgi:hypothetical protein